jgi:hypothetical protein
MALQVDLTTKSGVRLPTAYARILNFTGTKTGIQVTIAIFPNAEIANSKPPKPAVEITRATLKLADGASFAQMYDALKLQAPFIGAVSV